MSQPSQCATEVILRQRAGRGRRREIEAPAWSHQLSSYVFSEGPKRQIFGFFRAAFRSIPADVVSDGDDRRVPKARDSRPPRKSKSYRRSCGAAALSFRSRRRSDSCRRFDEPRLRRLAIAGNGEETEHLSGRLSASGGGWWRFRRSQVEKLLRADRGFCGGSASVCRTPWLTAVPRRVPRRVIAFLRWCWHRSCACFHACIGGRVRRGPRFAVRNGRGLRLGASEPRR